MDLRCEALDSPVWRAWLVPDEHGVVAIGGPGVAALEALLIRADADERCRVLVLASDADEFCRGMDLNKLGVTEPGHGPPGGRESAVAYFQSLIDRASVTTEVESEPNARAAAIAGFARVLERLRGLRAATVCLVEGDTSGGGVGLAAACDLVIAGPEASFALPELFFGLIPAVVLPVIAERIGMPRARWLALTGESVKVDQALRLGLVDERSDDVARTLSARLKYLLRCSPAAVARLKRFSADIAGAPLADALAAGVARTTSDVAAPEVAAAVASYLAGELPSWAVRHRSGGSP